MTNLWRLVRYGPGLYRATRRIGGSRWRAFMTAVFPFHGLPKIARSS